MDGQTRLFQMARIHIFRHGQTQWNLEKRLQGHDDSPLTQLGIEQAELAKERLSQVSFDAVLSSPSGRTVHTANILTGLPKEQIKTMEGLREIHLGSWEGLSTEEVALRDNERYTAFWNAPQNYKPDTGESFQDLRERGLNALEDIALEYGGQTVVVVSHAGWIKTVVSELAGIERSLIWQEPYADNLSESILCFENSKWRVEKFCDITWSK